MVTKEELEDVLWKEKHEAKWKDIEKRQNDPEGNIQQRTDREQYYVDSMTLDSRPMSIVGKEQGEHWWRFAPQAQEYKAKLGDLMQGYTIFITLYMTFWAGIALWFVFQF